MTASLLANAAEWARRRPALTGALAVSVAVLPVAVLGSMVRTALEWNVIETAVGRNLLRGDGYVDFAGAPPLTWRQPLGSVAIGVIGRVVSDPVLAWRCLFVLSLTLTAGLTYVAARRLVGTRGAAVAALLTIAAPGVTSLLATNNHTIPMLVGLPFVPVLVLVTLRAAEVPRPLRLATLGLAAGFFYLARTEAVAFVGLALAWLSVSWILDAREGGQRSWRERAHLAGLLGRRLAVVGGVAVLVASPWLTHLHRATGRLDPTGQGIYVFYNTEGWVYGLGGDTENEGYRQAVREYGTPEENGYNTLRAVRRDPGHFLDRLRRNVKRINTTLTDPGFVSPFAIALGLVALAARRDRRRLALPALMAAAVYSHAYIYPDPRYLTLAIPALSILAVAGGAVLWQGVRTMTGVQSRRLVAAVILVLTWLFWASPTVRHLIDDEGGPDKETVVADAVAPGAVHRDDVLANDGVAVHGAVVAYELDVRYSWGYPDGPDDYPRWKVLSMRNYAAEDVTLRLVDADRLSEFPRSQRLTPAIRLPGPDPSHAALVRTQPPPNAH